MPQPSLIPVADRYDKRQMLAVLSGASDWMTRRNLMAALQWDQRKIRAVLESLGADVVRGQKGFMLTDRVKTEELGVAVRCSDAWISQGKSMVRYGVALKRKLHKRIA